MYNERDSLTFGEVPVVEVLECDPEISEFELQLRCYVHFWTNSLGKSMTPYILPLLVG